MKKVFALLFAGAVLWSLTACGFQTTEYTTSDITTAIATTNTTVIQTTAVTSNTESIINGSYLCILESGHIQRLIISDYSDQDFEFAMEDTGIAGFAQLDEDDYFVYSDGRGQGINFTIASNVIYVNAGSRYGVFSGRYVKEEIIKKAE